MDTPSLFRRFSVSNKQLYPLRPNGYEDSDIYDYTSSCKNSKDRPPTACTINSHNSRSTPITSTYATMRRQYFSDPYVIAQEDKVESPLSEEYFIIQSVASTQLSKSAEHSEEAANMDSFKQLMTAMGVYHQGIDFIRDLPVELSQIILSKLDTQSLLNAAQVSRKWLAISKSTSSSRQRVRRHIRRRNQRLAQVLPPPPSKQSTTRILSKPMILIPQTIVPYSIIAAIKPSKSKQSTQTRKGLRL
ncbi:hypothetical protein TSAR_009869 [Trichomalopsis sarcophagae]|uniref:F-box domain-containing protein n=1 Tax=Trichomalopsis sarcophagae TaxID=543379 RepID=A0A232FJW4_9HYME|nr:hypothetical protein TSAR_009869 [Trichomalopsis sarcophagae]